jgi:sulfite reductase alpha subunit-like flavoprotein
MLDISDTSLRDVYKTLRVKLQPTKSFQLPSNPRTPLLLIGLGTGIAPLRSFIQERRTIAKREPVGDCVLIQGFRKTKEILYPDEDEQAVAEGAITCLYYALSREGRCEYVQDALRKNQELS